MDLAQLIERLEAATEPSRELDAAIFALCGKPPEHLSGVPNLKMWAYGDAVLWRGGTVTQGPVFERGATYPAYTASLDAALTLVPNGKLVRPADITIHLKDDGRAAISLTGWEYGSTESNRWRHPALALTIAALKARLVLHLQAQRKIFPSPAIAV